MPTLVDLFSGCGGLSAGFAARGFRILLAADAQRGKPSSGASGCNAVYHANLGVAPLAADLETMEPAALAQAAGLEPGELDVLAACPPCTGFSRTRPGLRLPDRARNGLVGRVAGFALALRPRVVMIENARELVTGRHRVHYEALAARLAEAGYDVRAEVHVLSERGLPQRRERALVVACRDSRARTLGDLWSGRRVRPEAATVRTALARLEEWREASGGDPDPDQWPGASEAVRARLAATPPDGGSWSDLARLPGSRRLLTPDCLRRWRRGQAGSHPDVYGRVRWDAPAPTIKRACSSPGNGRYTHPAEDRHLSLREMAALQGFPFGWRIPGSVPLAARYGHLGDAVPPLVAYQLAAVADWMLGGAKPEPETWAMPGTAFRPGDIRRG